MLARYDYMVDIPVVDLSLLVSDATAAKIPHFRERTSSGRIPSLLANVASSPRLLSLLSLALIIAIANHRE